MSIRTSKSETNIRILHIEDRFHPDYGYQLNNIAAVHHSRFEFHILVSKSLLPWHVTEPNGVLSAKDNRFERQNNVTITRLDKLFEIESRVWVTKLKKSIRRINPDVIFIHGIESFTAIRILLSNLKDEFLIVADTHNLLNLSKNKSLAKIFYFFFRKIIVRIINKRKITVFYTSEENKTMLSEIYEICEENIESCQIGTNPSIFYFDHANGSRVRSELGIPQHAKAIIYTGKLDEYKQPHLLLRALKTIEHRINDPLHVIFIGSKDEAYFEAQFNITFTNPQIKIHILPFVRCSELHQYYSAADFAVFPKFCTLSALDCQANKLPIIMEENETNRIRVKKGGLLYKKGSLEELSMKIYELLTDQELRRELSENGHRYVLENYNYLRIITNVEELTERKLRVFKANQPDLSSDEPAISFHSNRTANCTQTSGCKP
jgi:glycosyltransferase involved in cell wall biosynthesis